MGPIDRLRALDLAILDRLYTPVAHWAHDEFGVRARQLGFTAIAGLGVVTALNPAIDNPAIGFGVAIFVLGMESFIPTPRIGAFNPRRYRDRVWRSAVWAGLVFCPLVPDVNIFDLLWWVCAVSGYYFMAVTERPRAPRLKLGAAFSGGAA